MTVHCRWFEVDKMILAFISILRLFFTGTDFRGDWRLAASLDSMSHYMRMLFAATDALHLQCIFRRGTNCPFRSWEFILDCLFLGYWYRLRLSGDLITKSSRLSRTHNTTAYFNLGAQLIGENLGRRVDLACPTIFGRLQNCTKTQQEKDPSVLPSLVVKL